MMYTTIIKLLSVFMFVRNSWISSFLWTDLDSPKGSNKTQHPPGTLWP